MSRIGLLTVILPFVLLGGCSSGSKEQESTEQIIALERSALDEWAKGNTSGYARNFAESATYFDDLGAQGRIDGLEAARQYFASLQGKVPPHTYQMLNTKVQIIGNVGILTFLWQARTTDGQALPNWKTTVVYQRDGGTWRTIHANWSEVKEPMPPEPQ